MEKSELIREITTRMMNGDIDSFKQKKNKALWYACFIKVAEVINNLEKMSDDGLINFVLEQK